MHCINYDVRFNKLELTVSASAVPKKLMKIAINTQLEVVNEASV